MVGPGRSMVAASLLASCVTLGCARSHELHRGIDDGGPADAPSSEPRDDGGTGDGGGAASVGATYAECDATRPCATPSDRCARFAIDFVDHRVVSSACSPPCATDDDCPGVDGFAERRGRCFPFGVPGSFGVCLASCDVPAHCLSYQSCVPLGAELWCVPQGPRFD